MFIIESQKAKDLNKRLTEHNNGVSKYSSKKLPWTLVYFEVFENINEAMKRGYFLKKQRNKKFYKLIDDFNKKAAQFTDDF